MGKRIGSSDIASRPGGGCPLGLALSMRATRERDYDMHELLYVVAPAVLGEVMARNARELFEVEGSGTLTRAIDADLFTYGGDPIPDPKQVEFEPDNLRPGQATYGDQALDGSGASYARL